jgi:peroxiredoxin
MIKGFKIPKVIFRVREGDTSNDETICPIGGKWIDKSTDDYFESKRVILFQPTRRVHTNMFISTITRI